MKLVDFRFNYKKSVALDPSTKKPIVDASTGKPVEGNPPILIGREPVFRLFKITFVDAENRFELKPYRK